MLLRSRIEVSQWSSTATYDLAMLLDTDEGKAAATDFDLLAQVTNHKTTFFRSGWASHDTAEPGSLRLMPEEARIKDLRADYRNMAPMMFDERPLTLDDILVRIKEVQEAINK